MTDRRWLITGCSSGVGHTLARRLAAAGERVLATARDVSSLDSLRSYGSHVAVAPLDVRDTQQCAAAVDLAVQRFGGLDVLVNNAGYGLFGVVEEVSDAELSAQFDTNLYGPWRLTRLVLPLFRAQSSGHAIFTSSIAGTVAFPGLSAYNASKFALEGLAESLAAETAHLGIKVTILQMGGFATAYGRKLVEVCSRIDDYRPVVDEVLTNTRLLADNPEATSPEAFADKVMGLAGRADAPLRVLFGLGVFDYVGPVLKQRQADFDASVTMP